VYVAPASRRRFFVLSAPRKKAGETPALRKLAIAAKIVMRESLSISAF
jgi:hypothetical protein